MSTFTTIAITKAFASAGKCEEYGNLVEAYQFAMTNGGDMAEQDRQKILEVVLEEAGYDGYNINDVYRLSPLGQVSVEEKKNGTFTARQKGQIVATGTVMACEPAG